MCTSSRLGAVEVVREWIPDVIFAILISSLAMYRGQRAVSREACDNVTDAAHRHACEVRSRGRSSGAGDV